VAIGQKSDCLGLEAENKRCLVQLALGALRYKSWRDNRRNEKGHRFGRAHGTQYSSFWVIEMLSFPGANAEKKTTYSSIKRAR